MRRLVASSVSVLSALALGSLAAAQAPGDGVTDGVAWGDREFTQPADLAGWLSARGVDYDQWAALHPAAAIRLESPPAPEPAPPRALPEERSASPLGPSPPPAAAPKALDEPAADVRGGATTPPVIAGAVAFALLLLALALAPLERLRHVRGASIAYERRIELAVGGLSILGAAAVSLVIAGAL